jgi:hypothetical protein
MLPKRLGVGMTVDVDSVPASLFDEFLFAVGGEVGVTCWPAWKFLLLTLDIFASHAPLLSLKKPSDSRERRADPVEIPAVEKTGYDFIIIGP